MKKLLVIGLLVLFVAPCFAVKYTVEVTQLENDMLRTRIEDIQEWLDARLGYEIRQCSKDIILDQTDRNPDKLDKSQKYQLIDGLTLEAKVVKNEKP